MTFIPNTLSIIDNNNSTDSSGTNYIGTSSSTTGFNSLILTISSNNSSSAGGIQILFSNSNNDSTFTTFFSDTYLVGTTFTKTYPLLKAYYRVSYTTTSSIFSIKSRLCTELPSTSNNSISAFDNSYESAVDAFGKLRVSEPSTQLDIRFPAISGGITSFMNNYLQVCYKTTGTGSYSASSSKLVMNVTGNTDSVTSQSRNYCTYQPGKSLLFMMSAIIGDISNNVVTQVGYFDDNNGVYFSYIGGSGCNINLRNNGATIVVINQSNWNIDKMDGTGNSGLNLDFTKAQLFCIDMEWLGIGRIRFGFFAYGRVHYCHQIININALVGPYTTNINLPIRSSIQNTPGASGSLTQICATVISEGGYNPIGKPFTASAGPVNVGTSEVAVLAIRGGGSNYYHQNIIPTNLSVVGSNTTDLINYKLRLYKDDETSGMSFNWVNVSNNSVAQYCTPSGTLNTADSTIVYQDLFFGKTSNQFSLEDIFNVKILDITANIYNISDILVLTCQNISNGTSNIYSCIDWQEIY